MKLLFKRAGLIALESDNWAIHFLVSPSHWIWLHKTEPYDLCMEYYGFGPFVLLCVLN